LVNNVVIAKKKRTVKFFHIERKVREKGKDWLGGVRETTPETTARKKT